MTTPEPLLEMTPAEREWVRHQSKWEATKTLINILLRVEAGRREAKNKLTRAGCWHVEPEKCGHHRTPRQWLAAVELEIAGK